MPKNYITSDNLQQSLVIIANNMDEHFKLEQRERAAYVGKLLKGIIDDKTVTKNLPKEFRKPYAVLMRCPICNKKKIKDMFKHFKYNHYLESNQ